MTCTRRQALVRLGTTSLALGAARVEAATQVQAFPERPMRLITPYAAGGSTDALARSLADGLRGALGQSVIVDNKPGANTAVGAQAAAAAVPDGYTLLICTGATVVLNPLLSPRLSYNPERDLAPVSRVAVTPLVLAVNPKVPANSLAELIALAKANPGKLNYASTGLGSTPHLASAFLESSAAIDMTHIPYNGSNPAILATIAGDVQIIVDAIGSSLPHIKAGKLRALAVMTPERLTVLPDVPSVAESGFPGFDVSAWFGIMAPAKTPPEIIARLNEAIGKTLQDGTFRERYEALGLLVVAPSSAQAFGSYIRAEREKWGPVVKAKRIVLE